jgi:hypothetical protein
MIARYIPIQSPGNPYVQSIAATILGCEVATNRRLYLWLIQWDKYGESMYNYANNYLRSGMSHQVRFVLDWHSLFFVDFKSSKLTLSFLFFVCSYKTQS